MTNDKASDLVERLEHQQRYASGETYAVLVAAVGKIKSLRAQLAEHEANQKAYEEIIGCKTYREVADQLAAAEAYIATAEKLARADTETKTELRALLQIARKAFGEDFGSCSIRRGRPRRGRIRARMNTSR